MATNGEPPTTDRDLPDPDETGKISVPKTPVGTPIKLPEEILDDADDEPAPASRPSPLPPPRPSAAPPQVAPIVRPSAPPVALRPSRPPGSTYPASSVIPAPPPTMLPGALAAQASEHPIRLPDGGLHVAGMRIEDGDVQWVTDPWTGERIAPVVLAHVEQINRAARAASDSFETMRRMASFARKKLLREITRRIGVAREELATLITHESGKPKTLARFEVDRAISTFGLAAEESVRIGGEVIPLDVTESTATFRGHWQRVPRGPVLAITPFNFPLNLVAHKVAPALACGAPVVLKPAPQTPLTALRLAEIIRESGAPPDALQVVPCTNDVAEHLVRHEAFAVLSFTGSDKVGWYLKSIAGRKHVLLELGGNAACIVHEDVQNLSQVAALVCASAFNYAGQVCIKTQRLYAHRSIADKLLAELVPRAAAYKPEDPKSPTAAIGPMIDEKAAQRVDQWIDEAVAAGAKTLAHGARSANRLPATILRFDDEGRGLSIVEEEAFGPVLTVHVYDDLSDGLRMANHSRYGLQAGIFTDSISRMREAFDRLDVGALIVNDVPSTRIDAMPYGGRRDSGIGREGVRYAIEEMTDRKMLVMRG